MKNLTLGWVINLNEFNQISGAFYDFFLGRGTGVQVVIVGMERIFKKIENITYKQEFKCARYPLLYLMKFAIQTL